MKNPIVLGTAALLSTAFVIGQMHATADSSGTGGGDNSFLPGPDVIVGAIPNVSKYGSAVSGGVTIMSYAFGTTSCNIGTQQLQWFASPDNRHPFIPMNAYRYMNGRFEQIGMGWGKHGFTALQQTLCGSCQASSTGSYLGIGCSDPYSSSLNGSQSGLGCRSEVNASTGVFPGTINQGMPAAAAVIGRRVQIRANDLDPLVNPVARYVSEGQYITQDDAAAGNDNNNASWREFTVGTLSSGAYTITLTGATNQQKPAIEAWKTFEPAVNISYVDVQGDGRFVVGQVVRDNGNGTWHYEYAIQNLNSHRSGRSLSIPVPAGVSITNVGFKDVNYHSGDPFDPSDWGVAVPGSGGGSVEWTGGTFAASANSNALRFATLYNFWFDADQPPQSASGTLGLFRPVAGAPDVVAFAAQGPSVPVNRADLDGDGHVGGSDLAILLNAWGESADGDVTGDGSTNGVDLGVLLGSWG